MIGTSKSNNTGGTTSTRRLSGSCGRWSDGAKTTAAEERRGLRSRSAARTLGELWAERDASLAKATTAGGDELQTRRLERAIAQRTALAGLATEVDRPDHVVSHLGEPPLSLAAREKWRAAAGEIESYVARWGVDPGEPPAVAGDAQTDHFDLVRDLVAVATPAIEPAEIGGIDLD